MKETKEERFKRVAQYRVNKLLDSIRLLSNCSNKRMYNWNEKQLKKIWTNIDAELRYCKEKFKQSNAKKFVL